ncbi:Uu.00g033570.m01.CDS01 [Anthostomella pinea]|uniref:Uu.00g033570.m01.CDS01 n=1 Tax=Anthostomella pinea TaxID=933095 RepID=A0AAI8YAV9_9PEZI|nr:Uu.00g033570.m01.CDS01 [Anthostomella pinea]
MSRAHGHSPEFVPNPFIKKRNLEWSIEITGSHHDAVGTSSSDECEDEPPAGDEKKPTSSAVEAGNAKVDDHLGYFSDLLSRTTLSPYPAGTPHLPVDGYRRLYESNAGNPKGAHFIIHQHDHPIAGTHYDLRLQVNETSSASWAIMYGLPGDPNSVRLNRNATETRIHCLWNHLIETASHNTGSLLIWDTGTYSILPSQQDSRTANSQSAPDSDSDADASPQLTEQEKLHRAFNARKIRLRLHGTRLPPNYVLNLRLTRGEDATGRARSANSRTGQKRRRRRVGPDPSSKGKSKGKKTREPATSSDSEPPDYDHPKSGHPSSSSKPGSIPGQEAGNDDGAVGEDEAEIVNAPAEADQEGVSAMEREDEEVRRTNAYTGATNSIGSVHQRRWYLSLDREACGFVKLRREGRIVWEPGAGVGSGGSTAGLDSVERKEGGDGGRLSFPFYVRGAEAERSVVTGRLGAEVLRDEGVVGYVGRKGWQPVLK